MAVDTFEPLCSATDMLQGAFADLARAFTEDALAAYLEEASRACETECDRRLLPFTITESHRAEGVDPDELGPVALGPQLDLPTAIGSSWATAMGSSLGQLVRKVWLRESAHGRYPEMWTYSNVTIRITPSVGGVQTAHLITDPTPDTGLCWFTVGTWCPVGSLIQATYSGGYTTVPADLRRACKWMTAAILVRELDPGMSTNHDAGSLEAQAIAWLSPYRVG